MQFAALGATYKVDIDRPGGIYRCEPEKIRKGSPSPSDFDEFWAEARASLAREVPLDARMERVPERSTAAFDFYRISLAAFGAATLSTGVEIPDEGAPTWEYGMQYTTRMEKRPAAITNEAMYLKWKWRMNLANPATGLGNDALREGVKKIVAESGWKDGREDWYDVAARCFDFLVDNVAIGFSKYDGFPAISAWDRYRRPMSAVLWSHAADVDAKYSPGLRDAIAKMQKEGRATIGKDFDHSAPDWVDILKLGFPGMKTRADSYAQDTPFYRAERKTAADCGADGQGCQGRVRRRYVRRLQARILPHTPRQHRPHSGAGAGERAPSCRGQPFADAFARAALCT